MKVRVLFYRLCVARLVPFYESATPEQVGETWGDTLLESLEDGGWALRIDGQTVLSVDDEGNADGQQ